MNKYSIYAGSFKKEPWGIRTTWIDWNCRSAMPASYAVEQGCPAKVASFIENDPMWGKNLITKGYYEKETGIELARKIYAELEEDFNLEKEDGNSEKYQHVIDGAKSFLDMLEHSAAPHIAAAANAASVAATAAATAIAAANSAATAAAVADDTANAVLRRASLLLQAHIAAETAVEETTVAQDDASEWWKLGTSDIISTILGHNE